MPESVLRARFMELLGIRADRMLVNVTLTGATCDWELDLVDATSGLALEYDSIHHASTEQRERDALKDVEVQEAGLAILRINSMTLGKTDTELAAHLRRGRRRAMLLGGPRCAANLITAGALTEHPLRNYRSAVQ